MQDLVAAARAYGAVPPPFCEDRIKRFEEHFAAAMTEYMLKKRDPMESIPYTNIMGNPGDVVYVYEVARRNGWCLCGVDVHRNPMYTNLMEDGYIIHVEFRAARISE